MTGKQISLPHKKEQLRELVSGQWSLSWRGSGAGWPCARTLKEGSLLRDLTDVGSEVSH